jgi:Gram-negative bacterial TonB protein C-terminal
MKHTFYLMLSILLSPLLSSGQSSPATNKQTYTNTSVRIYDASVGGTLLEQTVAYPTCVEEQRARGLASGSATFLDFVVNEQGQAGQVSFVLTKGVGTRCAAEVETAIQAAVARLPRFQPTIQNGKAVPTSIRAVVVLPPKELAKPGPVDSEAAFPGGWPALDKALAYTLRKQTPADTIKIPIVFKVRADGRVIEPYITDSKIQQRYPGCAQYALNKVNALPAFEPARRAGKPVVGSKGYFVTVICPAEKTAQQLVYNGQMPVPLPLPPLPFDLVTLPIKEAAPRPAFDSDSSRIYAFPEQMPEFTSGGGGGAIRDTINRRLSKLLGPSAQSLSGKITVSFVVGPRGGVFEKKIVQGISPNADAAVLAALNNLPRMVPGKQNGQRAAVRLTLQLQLPLRQ